MVRKHLLDTLIEQSRKRRDEAAGVAAGARRATGQAAATLAQLHDYRREYDAKTPKRAAQRVDVLSIERHQVFVDRLDVAVIDQGRRQETARLEQALRESQLMGTQQRLKAFETLQLRQLQAARKRLEKLDQRATDEQATRLSFWKRTR